MKKIVFIAVLALSFLMPGYVSASDTAPVLSSLSSTSGDIDGGNTVTLSGSGFTPTTAVRVGGTVVPVTYVSSTEISVVMPPKTEGYVNVAAFSGMVGAVLPNSYRYIDIPDPTPTPTPTPTATPTPTPTPTVSSTPTPTPTPTPTLSTTASPSVAGGSSGPVSETQQTTNSQTITVTVSESTNEQTQETFAVYRYSNNVSVFTNATEMNVVATNLFTKRMRFTLQKRVDGAWTTIAIAWRNTNGQVTFYGVPLNDGSYRIVNASKPIKWFAIA